VCIEHGSEIKRKRQGFDSIDKNMLQLLERHFHERILPTEKNVRPTKRFVVLQTRQCFGAPIFRLHFVLKAVL
jgi:hypothetical protein